MRDEVPITAEQLPVAPLEALRRAIAKSPLTVGLVHLPRRRFIELSDRAKCLLGIGSVDLEHVDAFSSSRDRDEGDRLVGLLLDGGLDGYRAHRVVRRGTDETECNVCIRVVARAHAGGRPEAVVLVSFTPESEFDDSGTLSAGHLGEFVLTSLLEVVHPGDMCNVLEAFEAAAASADARVAVPVRCGGRRSWQKGRVLVTHLGDRDHFGLTVAPVDDDVPLLALDRIGELEHRLRRIGQEIEAAGLLRRATPLPDPDNVPGLDALSPRQWEIVTRLLRGERVPRIARAMYLSPSTVRNHLSMVFRKLGVRSQAELIDRLYPSDEP